MSNDRWLSLQEAADAIGISLPSIRTELRRARESGENRVFGNIHFKNFGQGKERGRWRFWGGDIGPREAVDSGNSS